MRLRKIIISTAVASSIFLVGCTPTYRIPVSVANRQKIKSDDIVVNTTQHHIDPSIGDNAAYPSPVFVPEAENMNPVAAGTGGLAGGIIAGLIITGIDDHELKVANKEITPIQNNLKQFHYMKLFEKSVTASLKQVKWLNIQNATLKYNMKDSEKKLLLNGKKYKTIMFIGTQYDFDKSFNALVVRASVELDRKSKSSDSKIVLFQNHYEYYFSINPKMNNPNMAIKVWDKNNDALLKSNLKKSAELISKMIALDIDIAQANLYKKIQKSEMHFDAPSDPKITGKIVKKIGSYIIVRAPDDSLYAFYSNEYA